MTAQEIQEARERLDAATPGPWTFVHSDAEKVVRAIDPVAGEVEIASWIPDAENDAYCERACWPRIDGTPCGHEAVNQQLSDAESADAAFIAHAPTDLHRALDALERVRALADRYDRSPIEDRASVAVARDIRAALDGSGASTEVKDG